MLVRARPFTKYSGIELMFVASHHHQLSTFFLAISHIPVKAVAEAKASAQGMAQGYNAFFKIGVQHKEGSEQEIGRKSLSLHHCNGKI